MHYVGVDLAWGERQRTGLAVLEEAPNGAARLLHVSSVRTDDEIVAALAPYTEGPCLVAYDAPLIVTNATGTRAAEQALNRDFRRFDAGAHPANLGKPEFADGPRGARLARRLKLDLDPRSGRDRRAIEVYPHPATVVLFGLDRILKYKQKQGRDLESIRAALLTLVGHVEDVVTTGSPTDPETADATWAGLRRVVEQGTRKSELRLVEDQLDAVVCAYVGLFADRHPDRTTIYDDPEHGWETGYVVTPSLVEQDPVRAYAERRPALVEAGEQLTALVTAILDDAGINYLSVTGRTKSVASFAEKARRRRPDGRPLYTDPLVEITDVVGVRVVTYVPGDVAAVADLLDAQVVVRDDRDMGRETASEGRFGYASRHLLVTLDAVRAGQDQYAALAGRLAQVQIRTVLQHAWAQFEHDIRYKGVVPAEHASEFDRRFTLAAGLLELADRELGAIRDRLRGLAGPEPGPETGPQTDNDPRLDPRELAVYLAGQYPQADWSRTEHYGWISGLLLELGLTSFDEVGEVLERSDAERIDARMDYRYPPGAVRRLDDALLAEYGSRYVALRGNEHRVEALTARLGRLAGA